MLSKTPHNAEAMNESYSKRRPRIPCEHARELNSCHHASVHSPTRTRCRFHRQCKASGASEECRIWQLVHWILSRLLYEHG